MPVAASNNLVKYDNPVLLSDSKVNNRSKAKGAAKASRNAAGDPVIQTEDILNSILPPREFEDDGQQWVQFVSAVPATRLDVINLQEQLDLRLQQRGARQTGLCPIREELYEQAFNELIRQVTINCAERGLLLLRVRDELRMSLAAYRTLYEGQAAFGMRKALQAEQRKMDMHAQVRALENERQELTQQVAELTQKCEMIKRREEDRRLADMKKNADEIELFRKTHANYTQQLQNLINPGK